MAQDNTQTADADPAIVGLRRQIAEKDTALAAEREGRERAESAAAESARRAEASASARVEADRTALTNTIAAAETELEALETSYAAALADGKHFDAAKINTQISDAVQRRSAAQTQLSRVNTWVQREAARIAQEEQLHSRPSPRGQDEPQPTWEQHLEHNILANMQAPDREFLQRADGAAAALAKTQRGWNRLTTYHDEALEAGLTHRSPEYYDYVESRSSGQARTEARRQDDPVHADGATVVDLGRKEGERVVTRQPPPATGLAPTRGAGAGGSSSRQNEDQVRLNESEVETALRSFPPTFTNPDTGKPYTRDESLYAYAREKHNIETRVSSKRFM